MLHDSATATECPEVTWPWPDSLVKEVVGGTGVVGEGVVEGRVVV